MPGGAVSSAGAGAPGAPRPLAGAGGGVLKWETSKMDGLYMLNYVYM